MDDKEKLGPIYERQYYENYETGAPYFKLGAKTKIISTRVAPYVYEELERIAEKEEVTLSTFCGSRLYQEIGFYHNLEKQQKKLEKEGVLTKGVRTPEGVSGYRQKVVEEIERLEQTLKVFYQYLEDTAPSEEAAAE